MTSLSIRFLVELEFENVGFWLGQGKAGVPGEKPLGARERTNNKLNTHIWRWRRDLNPGHIVGRRVLSPLRHPCPPRTRKRTGKWSQEFLFLINVCASILVSNGVFTNHGNLRRKSRVTRCDYRKGCMKIENNRLGTLWWQKLQEEHKLATQ